MSKIKESHRFGASKQLGYRLLQEGKYAEAEPMFRKLVDSRLNVLGDDNAETASAYQMLAFVLEKQDKYEEALKHYESSLNAYNAAHGGEGHPDADIIYSGMVKIYRMKKQFDQALAKSKSLLKIRISTLGEAHPKTAFSYHNVAICFYDQGRHKEALDNLNKALKVQHDAGDGDTDGIAGIYTTMAKILVEQHRFDKAMEIYQRVLRHQVKVFGQCSPAVALTYRNVALAFQSQSRTLEAWKACVEALKIFGKLMEDENPNAAWRNECHMDASPNAIRAEAKKTLQITQIIEKQMGIAMLPMPPKPTTAESPSTKATNAAIGNASESEDITKSNPTQSQVLSPESSTVATAAAPNKETVTAPSPTNESAADSSNSPSKRKLDHESAQVEYSTVAKKQKVQASEPSTGDPSPAVDASVTDANTNPTNDSSKPSTKCRGPSPGKKLLNKLRQIEVLEAKGLFNLTQDEITMVSRKQEILNQLGALFSVNSSLCTSGKKKPATKTTAKSPTSKSTNEATTTATKTHTRTPAISTTEGTTAATPCVDAKSSTIGDDCYSTDLAKKLRQIEALEEKGLSTLTEDQLSKLNSKQDILSQLAAFTMLGMSGTSPKNGETAEQQQSKKLQRQSLLSSCQ